MAKEALKERVRGKNNGRSTLTGEALPTETALYDTHRALPKAAGGTYTAEENVGVVNPREHMEEHGNLRVRAEAETTLKALWDDREQVRKLYNKVNNQLLSNTRRVDDLLPATVEWLEEQRDVYLTALASRDKVLKKYVHEMAEDDRLMTAALGVMGIGEITVAASRTYIDLTKAAHASSLWAYVGLDKASWARYEKGVKGGGNKTLRCVLWTMADSQMKTRGAYRAVYDRVKDRLAISEKIVKSRNTEGKMIECMWKDTKPCHRHGAALRAVGKHFLADYWFVGRELLGLDTNPLYAEAILGHDGHRTVSPKDRGWVW